MITFGRLNHTKLVSVLAFIATLFNLISRHSCLAHVARRQTPTCHDRPRLLIVSFDGFRWDYLDKFPTPNFDRVWKGGVKAKWVKNAFVTKTFPNHYTIATGLYEESHGIVNNIMYDPVWDRTFKPHNLSKNCDWFGGEPIWVTNQLQGKKHKSGSYFWLGSDCEKPMKGVHPTFYEHYNQSVPFRDRVDKVVSWFTQDNINLGLLYFHEPDHTGHGWGPDSPQMKETIKHCDSVMGYLLDKMETFGLSDSVNLIVTSDHGMEGYSENRTIYLDDYISPDLYFTVDGRPFKNIWPKKGYKKEDVYNKLKVIPHLNVYYREDIPEKHHYKNNRRVGPIFIMSDLGWQLANNNQSWMEKGDHGWSNEFPDMHPFFLARGPAFRKDVLSEPFNNVDIYPLMCDILKLKPAPNNGSLEHVSHLLKDKEPLVITNLAITISTYVFIFILVGGIGSLFILGTFLQCRSKPHHIIEINPASNSVRNHIEVKGLLTSLSDDEE